MGIMRHVGNAAYWAVFGTTWDSAGKSGSADPNCPTCNGRGSNGGLRAFPGDPGSGVAPIKCGCRKPDPPRNQRAAPAVEPDPDPAGIALLDQQLFGPLSPEAEAKSDAHAKARVERDTASGALTLCCKRYSCRCGENVRLWNGVPRKYPGTFLPGSVDEQQFHKAKAQYEAQQDVQNANETTLPLPSMFGGF